MYTLDEFMTAVDQSDGIVCYGIGKRFHMFLREFQETPIIEKLRFCIDAYAENQHIKTENRLLEVQGLSSLQTVRDHHYVLRISSRIRSAGSFPVPKVSTRRDTGWATPMA